MRLDIKTSPVFGIGFFVEDNRATWSGSFDLVFMFLFFGVRIEINRKREDR